MTQPRDLIVIGASLGGLKALNELSSGLTSDFPAAILIVLHSSPESPRMFAKILGQHTPRTEVGPRSPRGPGAP